MSLLKPVASFTKTTAETKKCTFRTDVCEGQWLKTQHMHMHSQTKTFRYLWETTRTVSECSYYMLNLFGLVLNLRYINLFPGEELPDASSVVLISQSVQEYIKGWGSLSQDWSHLQRQVQAQPGCYQAKSGFICLNYSGIIMDLQSVVLTILSLGETRLAFSTAA